ncbi:MAG: dTMP kinase [Acidimicrobiia bacterium]|nr:dTMP kinase [Acidimicrobiia bacterium]
MKPRYVVLEGPEGAGKSTVRTLLAARFVANGIDVVEVREPGGTAAGEGIRRVLLDPDGTVAPWTEALLFAAARSQLAAEVIGPALERGAWVIGDRSVYSSLAYQGAGRDLGIDTVRQVNEAGLGGMWPDKVVLLRIDASEGLRRQQDEDRIGAEAIEFHQAVVAAYDKLAAAEPERFVIVDAGSDVDDVVSTAYEGVTR